MSALIYSKLTEAEQLLRESRQEESQGAVLAQQIAELKRESDRLLKSAREKQVIGASQLSASQALAKEAAEAAGELTLSAAPAPAAPTKKGKGAKAAAVAPVAATPVVAAAPKGRKAKVTRKAATAAAAPIEASEPTTVAVKAGKQGKKKTLAVSPSAPKAPRATGEKGPPLHEKIKIVMGGKEMTIPEVIEALKAHDKSWVPKSQDLGAYISLVLSTHLNDHFDRVKRGVYKVKRGASPTPPTPPTGPGLAKTGPKKPNGGGSNGTSSSHGIDELGTNVLESPFSGAEAAA